MKRARETPKKSTSKVKLRLKTAGVIATGCDELLRWRLDQYKRNLPVRHNQFYINKMLQGITLKFTRLDRLRSSFFGIPPDVTKSAVLFHLSPRDVFSLMLTSRYFQAICHDTLHQLAKQRFGNGGTPMALLCEESLAGKTKKKCATILELQQNVLKQDTDIIKKCIEQYDYVDNLSLVKRHKAVQVEAQAIETKFIESHAQNRLYEVNSKLRSCGYNYDVPMFTLSEDDRTKCKYTETRIPETFYIFLVGAGYKFIDYISDYVYMNNIRSLDAICKENVVDTQPARHAFESLKKCFNLNIRNFPVFLTGDLLRPIIHLKLDISDQERCQWISVIIGNIYNKKYQTTLGTFKTYVIWYLDSMQLISMAPEMDDSMGEYLLANGMISDITQVTRGHPFAHGIRPVMFLSHFTVKEKRKIY